MSQVIIYSVFGNKECVPFMVNSCETSNEDIEKIIDELPLPETDVSE